MIKALQTFFYPTVKTYAYDLPEDIVGLRVQKILDKSADFFSGNDMRGMFLDKENFNVTALSGAMVGSSYRSKLSGQIKQVGGKTEITTVIKPGILYRVWFFLLLIFGMGGIMKCILTFETSFLIWGILTLVIGPTSAIVFSNFSVSILTDRYFRYIDTPLKKQTAVAIL